MAKLQQEEFGSFLSLFLLTRVQIREFSLSLTSRIMLNIDGRHIPLALGALWRV